MMLESVEHRGTDRNETESTHFRGDEQSPFVLEIPQIKPRQSIDVLSDLAISNGPDQSYAAAIEEALDEDPLHFKCIGPPSSITKLKKTTSRPRKRRLKLRKYSRHGIEYPSMPCRVVKSIAMTAERPSTVHRNQLKKETLDAIVEAGESFFEQLGGDLATFAKHAKRKIIDDTDIIAVMSR